MKLRPLGVGVLLNLAGQVACGGSVRPDGDAAASSTSGAGAGASAGSTASASASGSGGSSSTSGVSATSTGAGTDAGGFGACSGPGQCTLVFDTCCGTCAEYGLEAVEPIHEASVAAHASSLGCDDGACPPCAPPPAPDLFAYCDGATCVEATVEMHPIAACQSTSDCKLRWGLACCECGAEHLGLTAIRADGEGTLTSLVCESNEACDGCLPPYPPDAFAECLNGACEVVYAL